MVACPAPVFVSGLIAASLMSMSAAAPPDVTLNGPLMQGALVIGQVQPGETVLLDGQAVRVTPEGRFVIGFGRDHPAYSTLRVLSEHAVLERQLAVQARTYEVQHIQGLPGKMVTPEATDLARIRADQQQVRKARRVFSEQQGFLEALQWPTHGRISGVFGSARVLNGKPRQPHYGIDIAAPEGTPVTAPASGQVTLVHPDMYYTGATLVVDHGYGVSSTFMHLHTIEVEAGDFIAPGQCIATVGSSGRSTGPHLDWRINWFDTRLDPQLIAGPMPAPATPECAP